MRQYVTVEQHESSGGVFCTGIFNSWRDALNYAVNNIEEFKKSYDEPNDIFEFTEPFAMDGDGGWCIIVRFKAACWTHIDEPLEHYYYILFYDTKEDTE